MMEVEEDGVRLAHGDGRPRHLKPGSDLRYWRLAQSLAALPLSGPVRGQVRNARQQSAAV